MSETEEYLVGRAICTPFGDRGDETISNSEIGGNVAGLHGCLNRLK